MGWRVGVRDCGVSVEVGLEKDGLGLWGWWGYAQGRG